MRLEIIRVDSGQVVQIFNGAVVRPAQRVGSCLDNVMPPVQFSANDPFWSDNAFAAEGNTPCGYDLDNVPNILPLGGWDANSVSLAYRNRGSGRLWLIESDWQDMLMGE